MAGQMGTATARTVPQCASKPHRTPAPSGPRYQLLVQQSPFENAPARDHHTLRRPLPTAIDHQGSWLTPTHQGSRKLTSHSVVNPRATPRQARTAMGDRNNRSTMRDAPWTMPHHPSREVTPTQPPASRPRNSSSRTRRALSPCHPRRTRPGPARACRRAARRTARRAS